MATKIEQVGKKVVVIGGGIAGLTSAWKLVERGFDVHLYELEAETGGQARAFEIDGHTTEHGSHALFGYYDTFPRLIDELRKEHEIAKDMRSLITIPGWTLVNDKGQRALLTHEIGWPKLLSVMPSIFRIPWFSFWDKLRACWAALRLYLTPLKSFNKVDKYTSFDYGQKVGYSKTGILLWNSASLGLTNMFVEEQSAAILCGKHKLLVGTETGLSYQLPDGNLTKLYGKPARLKIENLGGKITTSARATSITQSDENDKNYVSFDINGRHITTQADYVVVALQPQNAVKLFPDVKASWTTLQKVSPVITMVVGLSDRVKASIDGRELGLSRADWTFSVLTDLSQYWPEYKGDKTILRVEIGHADLLPNGVDTDDDTILDMVKTDLNRLFPEIQNMKIEWSSIHKETTHLYVKWTKDQFSKKPTAKEKQVSNNVFLAGDWTTKGTIGMEAAANSGIEAANYILGKENMPTIQFRDVPL